ncbi:heparan-alpha-glucosaminide N-acetyltransferase domain-containing protein [Arthrobacter sp. 7Tela_A1]|uniref:heparan-alpha-glucosaminide N-acetyltransferase domain-containing protein n=1 Tax=Arthrobacter sp. 7Tela_A1 TaxID=3093745 RepID=UPI003BB815B0
MSRTRLTGIDAARGVALLGMMSTHIFPLYDPATGEPTFAALVFSGRASALFAVVAGIGLALLTGGPNPGAGRSPGASRRGIAARAVVIALIGLLLGGLDTSIAIILFHYAVLFLLVLPFTNMRLGRLAAWAGAWVCLSPVLAYLVRPWLIDTVVPPDVGGNITWEHFLEPATLLSDVLFTGVYPAVQWMSYLLIGMVIGRLQLSDLRVQAGLLAAGIFAAVGAKYLSWYLLIDAGGFAELLTTESGRTWPIGRMLEVNLTGVDQSGSWWWLAVSAPHSGTTFDLLHTAGTAAAVVAACLLLTRSRPNLLLPLSAAGAMTLTLYSVHIWVMALLDAQETAPDPGWTFWLQAAAAVLVGLAFVRLGSRGPLETVASGASRLARDGKLTGNRR